MQKCFQEIFRKQPDEIALCDEEILESQSHFLKFYDRARSEWHMRTLGESTSKLLEDSISYYEYWEKDDAIFQDIIMKIAYANEPFIDLASSEAMGLAPYILKINPQIPCLLTDMNSTSVKAVQLCLKNELLYCTNTDIAYLDINALPIKDNSISWITGMSPMTSSVRDNTGLAYSFPFQASSLAGKAVHEAYRILKPGGYFVTIEQDRQCDIDIMQIHQMIQERGKLFGIYSFEELRDILNYMQETSWKEVFCSAGFHIHVEKTRYKAYSMSELKRFLYCYSYLNQIRTWTAEEIVLNYLSEINISFVCSLELKQELKRCISTEFSRVGPLIRLINGMVSYYTLDEVVDILWEQKQKGKL